MNNGFVKHTVTIPVLLYTCIRRLRVKTGPREMKKIPISGHVNTSITLPSRLSRKAMRLSRVFAEINRLKRENFSRFLTERMTRDLQSPSRRSRFDNLSAYVRRLFE